MNKLSIFALKALRKTYAKVFSVKPLPRPTCEKDYEKAAMIIYNALVSDKPCMIGRFGSNELNCLLNYSAVKGSNRNIYSYVKGDTFDWWWNKGIVQNLHLNAGFFPPQIDKIEQFCELMLDDISEVDVLGSWLNHELSFEKELINAQKVWLLCLDPYWSTAPWTKALEGKKVLVVHPFAKTIEQQYKKRTLLFKNNLLPAFELKTIPAVQSIAGNKTEFTDWFEALEYMKDEIDKIDYDICLIGAGAYGFPLAAHVKRMGKKGFHMGGSLQLLFGIRGERWETGEYKKVYKYHELINEYWVKPNNDEKPENAKLVENGCYW